MKSNLRTGVIGAGVMGQNHVRIYKDISNLVGVFDADIQIADKISKKFEIKAYRTQEELLKDVNAVSVVVPTIFHKEVGLKCVKNKVHALIEKPLAPNLDDSKEIVEAFKKSNLKLAVGHIERHNNVVKLLKNGLESGKWGKIVSITARRFSSYPHRVKDVGVIFDLSIHDIDVICYLLNNNPTFICGMGSSSKNTGQEDNVNILMNFDNGLTGICQTNWLTPNKIREILITTTSHHIRADYLKQTIKTSVSEYSEVDESNLFKTKIKYEDELIQAEKIEPLRNELVDFLSCIENDNLPFVTGEEGMRAVNIAQNALNSMRSNEIKEYLI